MKPFAATDFSFQYLTGTFDEPIVEIMAGADIVLDICLDCPSGPPILECYFSPFLIDADDFERVVNRGNELLHQNIGSLSPFAQDSNIDFKEKPRLLDERSAQRAGIHRSSHGILTRDEIVIHYIAQSASTRLPLATMRLIDGEYLGSLQMQSEEVFIWSSHIAPMRMQVSTLIDLMAELRNELVRMS